MNFQKFKGDSYCVSGRHPSATKNSYGEITSKGSTLVTGYCSVCNTKKSMTVSDSAIQAEGLGSFFENFTRYTNKIT